MQMHLVIEPAAQRRNVTYHNIESKVDLESNYLFMPELMFQAVSRCESLKGMSERSELIPCIHYSFKTLYCAAVLLLSFNSVVLMFTLFTCQIKCLML